MPSWCMEMLWAEISGRRVPFPPQLVCFSRRAPLERQQSVCSWTVSREGIVPAKTKKEQGFYLPLKTFLKKKNWGRGSCQNKLAKEFQVKEALGFKSRDCSQKQYDEIPTSLGR